MILGLEVESALRAGEERHALLGGGGSKTCLNDLGIDGEQAERVLVEEGLQWLMHLPAPCTASDMHRLVVAAMLHALEAGFRLGKLYGGEVAE